MLDKYTVYARVFPAAITLFPLIAPMYYAIHLLGFKGLLTASAAMLAFTFLLTQFSRDRGKRKESALYQSFGGKPTSRILLRSDGTLSEQTKKRYHDFLASSISGYKRIPKKQELADPDAAMAKYDEATTWLKANMRGSKLHSLLLEENINYGFRRNLWALKPIGIFLSVLINCAIITAYYLKAIPEPLFVHACALLLVSSVLTVFWLCMIRASWVEVPAVAYAKTLLEFCDQS